MYIRNTILATSIIALTAGTIAMAQTTPLLDPTEEVIVAESTVQEEGELGYTEEHDDCDDMDDDHEEDHDDHEDDEDDDDEDEDGDDDDDQDCLNKDAVTAQG